LATIFSRIIAGEIPCYRVAEDDRHLAFLDVKPIKKGHTLVIPKREVDYLFDLSDEETAALHVFARKVALGLGKAVPCRRVGTAVVGLEVPHAHVHLIPLDRISDLSFEKPRLEFSEAEYQEIAAAIRAKIG